MGVYVTAIHNGACIRVCSVDFGRKGASKFIASVASASNGGVIELRLDGETGPLIRMAPQKGKPKARPELARSQLRRMGREQFQL